MTQIVPKVTFFMLVTNRDCIIADYAINSFNKIYNVKKPFGYKDFNLFIYLNCLSEENLAHYTKKWESYPYTTLYNNAEKIDRMEVKPFPGQLLESPEGIVKKNEDYAENCDVLWTTELKKFSTPYIVTVDADFEILNTDFYFYLINKLDQEQSLIGASSCYSGASDGLIYESYSNRNVYFSERNNTWFCIYRKEAFELVKTSHYYYEEKNKDGKIIIYDSAANFQHNLRKLNLNFIDAPPAYFGSFVHYGATSKNKTLNINNINYYRIVFILTYKGIITGENNFSIRTINSVVRKLSGYLFKNYLKNKQVERSTYTYT